jgi:hypothetical protein
MKKMWFVLGASVLINACTELVDESTLITDDVGVVHRTIAYQQDVRGRREFPLELDPTGRKRIVFDPKLAAWAAYDRDGHRVMTGSASGGKDYCEDSGGPCRTVTGRFHVYNKKGLECRSGEYPVETTGGAKMPYCMYFYRGFTIHAAYEVPTHNTSHGCIRVWPSAAKWLNEQFVDMGTEVTVLPYHGEDGDGAPLTSKGM